MSTEPRQRLMLSALVSKLAAILHAHGDMPVRTPNWSNPACDYDIEDVNALDAEGRPVSHDTKAVEAYLWTSPHPRVINRVVPSEPITGL